MSNRRRSPLAGAVAVLMLAACGGGGGGSGGGDGGEPRVGSPAELFRIAQELKDDAVAAAVTAAEAVQTAAEKSGQLSTLAVNGKSAIAVLNAQAVLDARAAANAAVTAVETGLAGAREALVAAEDLPEGNEFRASVVAALKEAIEVAEAQLVVVKGHAGGSELAMSVERVTGADANDPMTASELGQAVAADILGALSPGGNGAWQRGRHGSTPPADSVQGAVRMNDRQGQTWEEIVTRAGGEVIDTRIADGAGTRAAKAASVAGKALDSAIPRNPPQQTGDVTDGTQFSGGSYDGIAGTVVCLGADCRIEETGGIARLVGSWYFSPALPMELYVRDPDDATMYIAEVLYAQFGHWLDDTDGDGNTEVFTYARSNSAPSSGDLITLDPAGGSLADMSATYRGRAAGMSVMTDTNGAATASGAFSADVRLTATFGASPTLGGSVRNFEGSAVSPAWEVRLEEREFGGVFDDGEAVASGQNGVWSATSYGNLGARPAGIYGGFNAHFSNGHAAGAYATRKE